MSPEPRSRLTSVLWLHVFGLATCLDALTNGGGMMPTPDCRKPNPYGILSHSVCRWTALRGILCMDSCHSLSAMPWIASDFSLCPRLESWVCPCLPARSCASLVGSGLSVWLGWCWLLATRACHWVESCDRTIQKAKKPEHGTPWVLPTVRCLHFVTGFSLSWFACSWCLLVLVCQNSLACPRAWACSWCTAFQDMQFSKQLWQNCCFCMPLSFHSARDNQRCGLSTVFLSVTEDSGRKTCYLRVIFLILQMLLQ